MCRRVYIVDLKNNNLQNIIFRASEVEVTLGAHNIDEDEDGQVVLTSNDFVIHEEYNATTRHNDIALINLPAGVPLSGKLIIIIVKKIR